MALSNRQRVFIEAYLRSWNASDAARQAGYKGDANTVGPRLLANVGIAEAVKARLAELTMGPDEVLTRLTEQARNDIGIFFKPTEQWTFFPTPAQEVLDAQEVVDPDDADKKKVSYLVRAVVIDLDKLLDPQYSHLVKKFVDSPKNGLSLEMYDQQAALKLIGQKYGLFADRVEVTGKGGGPIQVLEVEKDYGPAGGDRRG